LEKLIILSEWLTRRGIIYYELLKLSPEVVKLHQNSLNYLYMTFLQALRSASNRIVFSLGMAIQVMNLSIDAVDPSPHYEDLSVNEIESCVEFVLEVVMDRSNAITETDDQDHHTHKPGTSLFLYAMNASVSQAEKSFLIIREEKKILNSSLFESLNQAVTSPPPKVIVA
jgi:hypothetical protein